MNDKLKVPLQTIWEELTQGGGELHQVLDCCAAILVTLKPLSHLRTDAADRSGWSTDEILGKE